MTRELVLASASPRRRELLARITGNFTVKPSSFEERERGLSARDTAELLACGKAREAFGRFPDCFVLGADTVVSLDGNLLGKPKSKEEARETLRMLSGKVHSVFTGVCLIGEGFFAAETAETKVEFYPLSEELIGRYGESGLPMDKAGAYGIQDGYPLVKSYDGSYENVVGLPLEEVRALLNRAYGGDTYVKTCD